MTDNIARFMPPKLEERHFHQRLRLMRTIRDLSQSDLASKADLQPSAVSHFEAGRRLPSFENLRSLAVALSCSADYLLGLQDAPARQTGYETLDQIALLSEIDREYVSMFVSSLAARQTKS